VRPIPKTCQIEFGLIEIIAIDLIHKSENQRRAKVAVIFFFHFPFSACIIIFSVLLQQSKSKLASHTNSHFFIVAATQSYNYNKPEVVVVV
jgi:hypothetical protein